MLGMIFMFIPMFGSKFWFLVGPHSGDQVVGSVLRDISGSVPVLIVSVAIYLFFSRSKYRPAWLSFFVIFPLCTVLIKTLFGASAYREATLTDWINLSAIVIAFLFIFFVRYKKYLVNKLN